MEGVEMEQWAVFGVIAGMALVTFVPRILPMQFLRGRTLHPLIISWLKFVPAAVLPAILVPMLLTYSENYSENGGTEGGLSQLHFGFDNIFLWTALLCLPLTIRFKSLSLPVILGMVLIAAVRYFGTL